MFPDGVQLVKTNQPSAYHRGQWRIPTQRCGQASLCLLGPYKVKGRGHSLCLCGAFTSSWLQPLQPLVPSHSDQSSILSCFSIAESFGHPQLLGLQQSIRIGLPQKLSWCLSFQTVELPDFYTYVSWFPYISSYVWVEICTCVFSSDMEPTECMCMLVREIWWSHQWRLHGWCE